MILILSSFGTIIGNYHTTYIFSTLEDENFPLFDEDVAPIASPDETCIDINAQIRSPDSYQAPPEYSIGYPTTPEPTKHIETCY